MKNYNRDISDRFVPVDTQCIIKGSFYKIDRFGRVFRHDGVEWITSTKDITEVKNYIQQPEPME